MAKFNTQQEAMAAGAAMFAAGKCQAWSFYRSFGKFIVRVRVGSNWFTLHASEV